MNEQQEKKDGMNSGRERVLVIGSGAREHALAWKLAQSEDVAEIVCAPGNPGMEAIGRCLPVDVNDPDAVVALARELHPSLVVIGPENPIEAGVSDALRRADFLVFGPSRDAGQLEWDKEYAKSFMKRKGIPTAASYSVTPETIEEGIAQIRGGNLPVVLKASGLAAGKGVVIAESHDEAVETLRGMLSGEAFGDAGNVVVVEEFMQGEEASIFAITDGTDAVLLAPSQDHKRIGDGDVGLNTGGMGAYAPAPVITPDLLKTIRRDIVEPTIQGMNEEGRTYQGCLYVGLMIDEEHGPRVVEFNCRFGDPETEVVLPIWQGDLYRLFVASATGTVRAFDDPGSSGSAVCVILASEGYPESYEKGKPITIDELPSDILVFHAGTTSSEAGGLQSNGGRVLAVTSWSGDDDLEQAIAAAYRGVERIAYEGKTYRRDIGQKGLQRAGA